VSAYRFKGITYQFLVNAKKGEVQGGRPYSLVKISLFILSMTGACPRIEKPTAENPFWPDFPFILLNNPLFVSNERKI
jgi:hypothetical protein